MLSVNQIYHGDARELLKRIAPDSVKLAFWSPPYHLGKQYEAGVTYDEWRALLSDVIALHTNIVKPGGFLVINIADILAFPDPQMPRIQAHNVSRLKSSVTREQVLAARTEHPHMSRYELAALLGCSEQTIDRRLNGNNIRGGKYNTQTRVHLVGGLIEQWAQDAGFYMYDRRIWVKDPAWHNSQWHSLSYRAVDEFEYVYVFWKPGVTNINRAKLTPREWSAWGSRAVWHIRSVRANDDHEAKFPVELARRVIKLFSDPDDVVLDCFVGSGTTALAAIELQRRFIGMDVVTHYAALAALRCQQHLKKQSQLSLL